MNEVKREEFVGFYQPEREIIAVFYSPEDESLVTEPIFGFSCWKVVPKDDPRYISFSPIIIDETLGLAEEGNMHRFRDFISFTWREDFEKNIETWREIAEEEYEEREDE